VIERKDFNSRYLLTGHIHKNRGEYCNDISGQNFCLIRTYLLLCRPFLVSIWSGVAMLQALRALTIITSSKASTHHHSELGNISASNGANHLCALENNQLILVDILAETYRLSQYRPSLLSTQPYNLFRCSDHVRQRIEFQDIHLLH